MVKQAMSKERDGLSSYAPLPLRILVGVAFILHGLPKLTGLEGTQGFFNIIGLPQELALPIALLEVIGGMTLLIGLLTRVVSILFIVEMIGAIMAAKLDKGFVGGYELELLILAISLSLLMSGPGRVSIERDVIKREIFPALSR
jgi:putative oxidoreductase